MHAEGGSLPSSLSLYAIPKLIFNLFACVREAKDTLLRDGCQCNTCPPSIDHNGLVPNMPHECGFFARVCQIPHLRPINLVVSREVTLPFVRYLNHADNLVD